MSVDFDVVDALAGLAEDLRSEGDFVARIHDAVATMKQERDEARAEVAALRAALTCPGSDYAPPTHRCVRCDSEVGP